MSTSDERKRLRQLPHLIMAERDPASHKSVNLDPSHKSVKGPGKNLLCLLVGLNDVSAKMFQVWCEKALGMRPPKFIGSVPIKGLQSSGDFVDHDSYSTAGTDPKYVSFFEIHECDMPKADISKKELLCHPMVDLIYHHILKPFWWSDVRSEGTEELYPLSFRRKFPFYSNPLERYFGGMK